jgi:hypothetical protein
VFSFPFPFLIVLESEENKKTEDIVAKLKEKIAKKKQTIQEQQTEIGKHEDIKLKVIKAEQLFEESKSHLLTWIQLAIKLEVSIRVGYFYFTSL